MPLHSDQLHAFYRVAQLLNFSKAAKELGLSQPALSIRIQKLEEELKTSLFVREPSGVRLTETGERLFSHCQVRGEMERELLGEIQGHSLKETPIRGLIRIAGFSTIVKSALLPCLSELVLRYDALQLEIQTREMHELQTSLKRAEADFVITEGPIQTGPVESVLIGHEENVLVESKHIRPDRQTVYFDNDSADQSTFNFFKAQKGSPKILQRWFLDNAGNILEAVEQGWGRAVHPRHLVESRSSLRVVPGFKTVRAPVYLNYYRQPYYSQLHLLMRNHLIQTFGHRLSDA